MSPLKQAIIYVSTQSSYFLKKNQKKHCKKSAQIWIFGSRQVKMPTFLTFFLQILLK